MLYDALIAALEWGIGFSGRWVPKNRKWAQGREGIIEMMRSEVAPDERIFWVHAASVGEFEQGRPLIEFVKEHHPEYKILVTFYSPSGYELRRGYKGADHVFYFPSDKKKVVRQFLDAIHPEIAVFIKYEFWLNTLFELRRRGIRTFLVSSIFRKNSTFFKPWGGLWRKALGTYETIFVQNESSLELLDRLGLSNVVVAGDTRFDRVHQIVLSPKQLPLIDRFCGNSRVLVAGSTWGPDEELLVPLANDNPDIKFIIAPHEMDESRINSMIENIKGGAVRYTSPGEDLEDRQVLIVDTIGLLSSIYKYASWAYVGGGFGVGIHNTVEPASYGLPLAFGPKYKKFDEAVAMTKLGVATVIHDYSELSGWFSPLKKDEALRQKVCQAARNYTTSQLGATDLITKIMGL